MYYIENDLGKVLAVETDLITNKKIQMMIFPNEIKSINSYRTKDCTIKKFISKNKNELPEGCHFKFMF